MDYHKQRQPDISKEGQGVTGKLFRSMQFCCKGIYKLIWCNGSRLPSLALIFQPHAPIPFCSQRKALF